MRARARLCPRVRMGLHRRSYSRLRTRRVQVALTCPSETRRYGGQPRGGPDPRRWMSGLGDGNDSYVHGGTQLTRLLMDSLSGRARALLVACVSPSSSKCAQLHLPCPATHVWWDVRSMEESANTLSFASRAARISVRLQFYVVGRAESFAQIRPVVACNAGDALIFELRSEVRACASLRACLYDNVEDFATARGQRGSRRAAGSCAGCNSAA